MRSHGFSAANNANVKGVDNYRYRTPAVFLQAYRTYLEDRLELNGSIRLDRHNVFGSIASPRLNALYHHTDEVSSRFSIGSGFRAPTSFFEQDHGILDDIRIIRMLDKPGKSDNLSYADERLAVTSSYNYNRIHHMATLTPGVADPAGSTGTVTLFENSPHTVAVQGVDINMSYQLTPSTVVSLGGERFHYAFAPGTLIFSRPRPGRSSPLITSAAPGLRICASTGPVRTTWPSFTITRTTPATTSTAAASATKAHPTPLPTSGLSTSSTSGWPCMQGPTTCSTSSRPTMKIFYG